ncbi:MAG: hypothetical protein C5B51_27665 [Terriglobia bacterium]|nr:MAG: hypothetical protein C5B51_27665 [Terriglobia bacterium]
MPTDSARNLYVRKRNGLVAIAVGFAGLYALCLPFQNQTNLLTYAENTAAADPAVAIAWSLAFLVATNLGLFGFFGVLAGLKELPLETSARARAGFRLKMAGANALALALWLVAVAESSPSNNALYAVIIPAAWLGVTLVRRGFRYDAISAAELLAQDARAPVVYLRSFRQDDDRLVPIYLRLLVFFVALNFEQILAAILSPIGPFVAVGRPSEELPELGAARMYLPDDRWREKVCALLGRARLVVIRLGATDNVWWEIEQALRMVDPARLIFVVVESGKKREQLLRRLGDMVHCSLREPEGRIPARLLHILNFGLRSYEAPLFVTFHSQWEPRYERCGIRWGASVAEHPAWPSIEHALRNILRDLALDAPRRKSRGAVFVLALVAGWAGGHWFYLGEKRRGLLYLLFFWTMVPEFLALRDLVRLTLATRKDFEARYPGFATPEDTGRLAPA